MAPSATTSPTIKKYVLVTPAAFTKEGQLHTAMNADKFQAARKLASDAHRATKKMTFDIVIKEKLSQEKNALIKSRGYHKDDERFFSAYSVVIQKDESSYKKAGKTLTSMFKPVIHAIMQKDPRRAALIKEAKAAWDKMNKSNSPSP